MLRVNDKEWEIEVNGFPVGHLFGSLRAAFQKFHDPQDGTMAHILWAMFYGMLESHNGSWKKVKRARGKTSKPVRRFSVTQETIENTDC